MEQWKLPEWMEKYRFLIVLPSYARNIEQVINEYQTSVYDSHRESWRSMLVQITLLERLKAQGMLVHENMESYRCD